MQSKKYTFHWQQQLKRRTLGSKKLHVNKKGNSISANSFLKFLRSRFWNNCTDSNCSRIKDVECISELSEVDTEDVSFKSLKDIQIKNFSRIVLAHLNTDSLRSKLDLLADQIKGNILAISETKLVDSFPAGQFKIPSYASPFRLDGNQNGGGTLVFVWEYIPVKLLSSEQKPIEAFIFESNFHKKKWLACCSYHPNKSFISKHLDTLRKSLDLYSAHYENTILIGDFNVSIDYLHMESFCESCRSKSLINDKTSFKNPENPFCIDLILTKSPYSSQNSSAIETGLSDFHMIVSVMILYQFW